MIAVPAAFAFCIVAFPAFAQDLHPATKAWLDCIDGYVKPRLQSLIAAQEKLTEGKITVVCEDAQNQCRADLIDAIRAFRQAMRSASAGKSDLGDDALQGMFRAICIRGYMSDYGVK